MQARALKFLRIKSEANGNHGGTESVIVTVIIWQMILKTKSINCGVYIYES